MAVPRRISVDTFLSSVGRCDALLRGHQQHEDSAAAASSSLDQAANATGTLQHAANCMAAAMATLPSLQPHARSVLAYFYGSSAPQSLFRLPGCTDLPIVREGQGRKGTKVANFQVWRPRDNASECLWSNMPFGKTVAIVLLARALGVTHMVESGRAGGLQLVHYVHFGFDVTSIELYPLHEVSDTLRRLVPPQRSLRMHDGNGNTLVPEALDAIAATSPRARVAVVLDGPKGASAVRLARKIASRVAFVACDDQFVPPEEWAGRLSTHVADPLWRKRFPLERDLALTAGTKADREFHPKNDDLALLFGDRWRP